MQSKSEPLWQFRIIHILSAIERCQSAVSKISKEEFTKNDEKWGFAAYQFIIIGEAVRFIPNDIVEKYRDVSWEQIRGLRNRIAHDYLHVDVAVLWNTIQDSFTVIHSQLEKILKENPAPEDEY